MNDIARRRLFNKVVESLKNKGYNYKPFDTSIKIYIDMKQQEEIILERVNSYGGTEEGKEILLEALQELSQNIQHYEKALLLD